MELPPAWSQICSCGRSFSVPQAYTCHKRSCTKSKKRLAGALEKAKEVWRAKKRQKVNVSATETSIRPPNLDGTAAPVPTEPTPTVVPNILSVASSVLVDIDQSLAERRGRREHRQLPRRYRDVPPDPPAALPAQLQPSPPPHIEPMVTSSPVLAPVRKILKSTRNIFGLFRQYYATHFPEHDPDENLTPEDLMDTSPDILSSPPIDAYHPYPNRSSFLLGEWYWNNGAKNSQSSFKNLLEIVGQPDFRPEDVAAVNWKCIDAQLGGEPRDDGDEDDEDGWEDDAVGGKWIKTPIKINVPFHKRTLHPGQEEFDAGILYHRRLVSVIREKITSPSSFRHLHFEPYELFYQPDEACEPVRVHGELYSSKAFIDAHRDLQDLPGEPGCKLPRAIVGLMFASDGTQLTMFSNNKLWPVYLAIGNESKYRRTKPSCQAFEHVAYFETLPDAFKAFVMERYGGKGPNSAFMAHCSREMYDAQWDILLDDEFLEAYKHGIVIDCCDEIRRRFYPRIFIYSADYREKILLANIRNLGRFPCPRCLIPMDRVGDMGKRRDIRQRETLARVDDADNRHRVATARDLIYKKNYAVDSEAVKRLLGRDSLVPTANPFSRKLGILGLSKFRMLAVDLMHEVEINVWKALLIHLLRILDCQNEALKHELDRRYQGIPPFGRDGIQKITSNRSELKKMTAHDYEDLLQCAIPVFDGLLPEPHNTRVLKLLFNLAHWHGLAKLRMHTEPTLDIFSQATTSLGSSFRDFQEKTCTMFQTRELERERAARQRRQGKRQGKQAVSRGGRPAFATSNDRISSEGTGEPTNATNHNTGPTPANTDSRESADATNHNTGPTPANIDSRESADATNHNTGPTPANTDSRESADATNHNTGPTPANADSRESADATNPISEPAPAAPNEGPRKPKHLNLKTYTYHALGDYVKTISYFGTTDSYSTQSSELEHRTSKARFARTSGRLIPLQLSKIERRQRNIHAIREKLHRTSQTKSDLDDVANDPRVQYNIGKTQNTPIHVPTFLQKNDGDPATKNFFTKLRQHLLPRIKEALRSEAASYPVYPGLQTAPSDMEDLVLDDAFNFIFLKNDRIYQHQLSRFHFTTYDVRRGTDIINPGTSRCNVMLIADTADAADSSSTAHRFLYARVLGVYHANVVYTGPGMRGYGARRLDFLWVRWYEIIDPASSGWNKSMLDSVRFPPMNGSNAFGFVDPKDVMRACHILPNFAKGKRHADGVGISRCAKDAKDYHQYYVGRFSERDLLMRYHWGLGVGHLHAHQPAGTPRLPEQPDAVDARLHECDAEEGFDANNVDVPIQDADSDAGDFDDPELSLEDRNFEGWEDIESEGSVDMDVDEYGEGFTGM